MTAFYNEIDLACGAVLNELISTGVIAPGIVESRSIKEVNPDDIRSYTQAHFFAGGGLWSVAARLAGWPDTRSLWTASCPCQPFSQAGKQRGVADERHLWPDLFRLVRAVRPPVLVGEQVAGAAGYGWFDGVRADLEGEGYACRAVDIPACSVDAPHIRNRLYWIAVAESDIVSGRRGAGGRDRAQAADAHGPLRARQMADAELSDRWPNDDVRGSGDAAQANGRFEGAIEPGKRDAASGGLVDAARLGWREGRSKSEFRSGRDAAAVADAPGDLGDAFDARLEGQPRHGDAARGRPVAAGSIAAPDGGDVADAESIRQRSGADEPREDFGGGIELAGAEPRGDSFDGPAYGSFWSDAEWIICHDGKARRAKSGLRLLVDGVPGRVDRWRIAGNAIVPELAAEVLKALMETS